MASNQPAGKPYAVLQAEARHPVVVSNDGMTGFFKSAQWSADGTTIFTSSSTNIINTYVLPDCLDSPAVDILIPQGTLSLPEPTNALAPCPYYTLHNPYTHVILAAVKDHPITLYEAFPRPSTTSSPTSPLLANYPLIHAPTEAYQTPTALLWPLPGTHFIAGTKNLLAYFDMSRSGSGSEPILRIPTIPSARTNAKGGGVGMRGTVASLSVPSSGWDAVGMSLVAAGTWTRWVGIYDLLRAGECVSVWSVKDADQDLQDYRHENGVGGNGIMQTIWSPCGRYLVINERKASGLLVYDVRGTGRLLCVLTGRDGDTNQRLSCDVYPASDGKSGFEVWAGTKDGRVLVWESVGDQEGYVQPTRDWKGHESAVGSTSMHRTGSVVATCSGEWTLIDHDERESSDSESSSDDDSGIGSESDSESESGSNNSDDSSDSSDSDGDGSNLLRPRIKIGESSLKIWLIQASLASPDKDDGAAKEPETLKPADKNDSIKDGEIREPEAN